MRAAGVHMDALESFIAQLLRNLQSWVQGIKYLLWSVELTADDVNNNPQLPREKIPEGAPNSKNQQILAHGKSFLFRCSNGTTRDSPAGGVIGIARECYQVPGIK